MAIMKSKAVYKIMKKSIIAHKLHDIEKSDIRVARIIAWL